MRHVPINLYIDTEVFKRNDLRLDTGGFRELKDTFVKGELRLLVPGMMERELFRKYEERAKEAAEIVKKAHDLHPVSSLQLGDLPSRNELEKQCLAELKRQWEVFKEHFIVEKLPLVGNLEDVVNWYFEIKAPFASSRGKQKEFPDAFILSALEHYHQENQASIAVITNDGSFGEACVSRRYIGYYSELRDYIKAFIPDRTTEDFNSEPIDLTQPIVTEDLTALKEILGRGSNVTSIEVDRVLKLLRSRGENYRYFFSKSSDPIWLSHLEQNDYFKNPPDVVVLSDGSVQYPFWPELEYLKNVSQDVPEEVLRIVLEFPEVNNPRVYNDILDIALSLNGELSARLKPKVLECARLDHQFFSGIDSGLRPELLPELLAYWTSKNQTQAALELADILVQFHPDPQAQEKQEQRRENSPSLLEPAPKFDERNYHEILDKGVRPLADKEPSQVARMLIDATASMIRLEKDKDELESGTSHDYLEICCPYLNGQSSGLVDTREILVHALAHACEKVYEQSPEAIASLDSTLRNQRWDVFKRLRQYLYALHPNEQTKPWIRELILEHGDYAKSQHQYEFQQMIRLSCEHFGTELLTENERTQIFDAILSGPSMENYREWMGERFTETDFDQWKHNFHHRQLRPFASVLFGEYATYFEELKNDEADEITDETYLPFRTSEVRKVIYRSPRSSDELSKLSDEELLDYINEWQDEYHDRDDWFIKVDISALAEAFQSVFTKSIIPDNDRLAFWTEKNRERIERPIYAQRMIQAMHTQVEGGTFEQLDRWFDFCKWVISHSDEKEKNSLPYDEPSREDPTWRYPRSAVCYFVNVCLKDEANVPISARKQLAEILETLCTQFDWALDQDQLDQLVLLNRNPATQAINTTRGLALANLGNFGNWVHRHDDKAEVSEVMSILEKRFKPEAEYLLTIPEYAILGMRYWQICQLNQAWAVDHKSDFFPQDNVPAWQAAFGNFLHGNHPYKPTFDIVRDEFEFALEHLDHSKQQDRFVDTLGRHLFTYYLWGVYPLTGNDSLLECFYQKSDSERKHWATLFDNVGRLLQNAGRQLDGDLKDRTIVFFEWRLEAKEPMELRKFTFWLEAKCLEAEWRLEAYSKILDVPGVLEPEIVWPSLRSLHTMLPEHTVQVVKCFAKLIHSMPEDRSIYVSTDEARAILKAGFDHDDESVRNVAEDTRENLLRRGYLSFLDLDD